MLLNLSRLGSIAGLLLTLALAGCATPTPQTAQPGTVVEEPCRFRPKGITIKCARFFVQEDHENPASPVISVPVVTILATSGAPKPDPIVYLGGGPGASIVSQLNYFEGQSELFAERDLIIIEPRGNGMSEPFLGCADSEPEALAACAAALAAAGHDINQYDTPGAAADVAALRRALGVEAWNLYGVSYGTRWALMVVRDHPEGVRSVILDSASPPALDIIEMDVKSVLDGLSEVLNACAADSACTAKYGDVRKLFWRMVEARDKEPLRVNETLRGPLSGLSGDLDGLMLATFVAAAIKNDPQLVGAVPATLAALADGDLPTAMELLRRDPPAPLKGFPQDRDYAVGVEAAVFCREAYPFSRFQKQPVPTVEPWPEAFTNRIVHPQAELCRTNAWPGVTPGPATIQAATVTDIPMLALAGRFDTITRPGFADFVAKTAPNTFVVVAPDMAHGVLEDSACARQIAVAFLEAPTQKPDTSCLAAAKSPTWR